MGWLFWTILIVPGLVAFYLMIVRPILSSLPVFKRFYQEANGFWAKVSAIGGHSLTIAWSYLITLIGGLGSAIDIIGPMLGDPDLKQQLTDALAMNPKVLGQVLMAISIVTIVTRLRTLGQNS
jgi:hypothetical protein